MEPWALIAANVLGVATLFAGIALCVRFDQQGKTRRRTLEHAERMRAIESGRPPDDASVARYQALGAVGVAVPVASLSAAVIGGGLALYFREPEWRFAALAVIWLVSGGVCLTVLPRVVSQLQERPTGPSRPNAGSTIPTDEPAVPR